jgi:hypothetical protein
VRGLSTIALVIAAQQKTDSSSASGGVVLLIIVVVILVVAARYYGSKPLSAADRSNLFVEQPPQESLQAISKTADTVPIRAGVA